MRAVKRLFRSSASRIIVYSDGYKSYDVLNVSEFHHLWINHSKLFADKYNHINGIENFWNQAKRRLRSYQHVLAYRDWHLSS
jgi:transposase-like protein